MNDLYYICKYTPVELLKAFGANPVCLDAMPDGFKCADRVSHPNLCGFGKSVIESVFSKTVRELVLVNCCDSIKSVYDLLLNSGQLDFLYLLDMLHSVDGCSRARIAAELKKLALSYLEYSHASFDISTFRSSFDPPLKDAKPYIAVIGARVGKELFDMMREIMPIDVINKTCVHNRSLEGLPLPRDEDPLSRDFDALMDWYAGELLGQLPCMRMKDTSKRKELFEDPNLSGIIYHTIKFCDFYSFEYIDIKNHTDVPLLKIESDYTLQNSGQLKTRLEAFAEHFDSTAIIQKTRTAKKGYYVGIDSGSSSTDVVILNEKKEVVASIILPTGAGASSGAERALKQALEQASLKRNDILKLVSTGYGRSAITSGDKSITEISCHAKGAYFLDHSVRTVIDIGGQDSKVIRLNPDGSVHNFVMNDKCAAGTGRFLETMARALEVSLDDMGDMGLDFDEDITISNMCTVFAESEVVSLIAQNKSANTIVHGLDKAVAAKTVSLIRRAGGMAPYMMTGGVAKNRGVVKALEGSLRTRLIVNDIAQLCGALGAALFAMEMA